MVCLRALSCLWAEVSAAWTPCFSRWSWPQPSTQGPSGGLEKALTCVVCLFPGHDIGMDSSSSFFRHSGPVEGGDRAWHLSSTWCLGLTNSEWLVTLKPGLVQHRTQLNYDGWRMFSVSFTHIHLLCPCNLLILVVRSSRCWWRGLCGGRGTRLARCLVLGVGGGGQLPDPCHNLPSYPHPPSPPASQSASLEGGTPS